MNDETVTPKLCEECNAQLPEDRKKFCSPQCGTRNRVRRHRVAHSNGEAPAQIRIRKSQLKKEILAAQVLARKTIRRAATRERQKLKQELRHIGLRERLAISTSNSRIANEFEIQVHDELDTNSIAIGIAAHDARHIS